MLCVHTVVNYPVTSNCYILFDKEIGHDCIIIDPGSKNNDKLFAYLAKERLEPKYVFLTHEHFDHCWGINSLLDRYAIPIVCTELCAEAIKNEKRNCSVFYNNMEGFIINHRAISIESIDRVLAFGNRTIHFINTPGHTEASMCFVVDSVLFSGDTLIKNERTITKLPTGSVESLKDSLSVLEEYKGRGYVVYPGHGDTILLDDYDLSLA